MRVCMLTIQLYVNISARAAKSCHTVSKIGHNMCFARKLNAPVRCGISVERGKYAFSGTTTRERLTMHKQGGVVWKHAQKEAGYLTRRLS